jgi:multiple RNA-binding domain-containing protein 1
MGIPKTAILNPDSSSETSTANPAVKLALAETHIITETKAYLEQHGVVLSSFQSNNSNSRPRRSDTIILVKNIPYGTTETAIRELFEPHGELRRVLVPPAGTIAVVEYVKAEEAVKGFKSVVYRRMGNSVVYLEKGPVGMFMSNSVEEDGGEVDEETRRVLERTVVRVPGGADNVEGEAVGEVGTTGEAVGGAGTTLYVKNLSFATTQENFSAVFSSLPSFLFARIQTKPDPKKPNSTSKLSMGYGFVGFKDPESAKKAMKSIQGFVLDGHELNVKFAGRGKEEMEKDVLGATTGSKGRTTKMIVKNVPFEATKKDIRDLFRWVCFSSFLFPLPFLPPPFRPPWLACLE